MPLAFKTGDTGKIFGGENPCTIAIKLLASEPYGAACLLSTVPRSCVVHLPTAIVTRQLNSRRRGNVHGYRPAVNGPPSGRLLQDRGFP